MEPSGAVATVVGVSMLGKESKSSTRSPVSWRMGGTGFCAWPRDAEARREAASSEWKNFMEDREGTTRQREGALGGDGVAESSWFLVQDAWSSVKCRWLSPRGGSCVGT